MRPMAFVAALWSFSVDWAVGESLCPEHGIDSVFEAKKLPTQITHVDARVAANDRLDDHVAANGRLDDDVAANDRLNDQSRT